MKNFVLLFTFAVGLLPSVVSGQVYPHTLHETSERQHMPSLLDEFGEIQGLFKTIIRRLSNGATTGEYNVKFSCLNDTKVVIEGISQKDTNALMFLDSDFKVPSGILDGNLFWTGDYDECISIKARNRYTNMDITGKYFSVLLSPKQIPAIAFIMVGVCLPRTCERSDAKNLLSLALSFGKPSNMSVVSQVFDIDKPDISPGATGAMVVVFVLVTIVAIGTAVDVMKMYFIKRYAVPYGVLDKTGDDTAQRTETNHHLNGKGQINSPDSSKTLRVLQLFKAFSIFSNTTKLINTSTASGPLSCLNGLRVISICWVIHGHTYVFSSPLFSNAKYARDTLPKRFTFQAIINGTYSVDTFFFMSGLLVSFLALKELKSKGHLNWLYYFGHRFWRLTPMYAFLLLLFTFVTPYLVYGPFRWFITEPHGLLYTYVDQCKHYWWSNLLYINNLYPDYGSPSGCMAWTWYLANDMQFYVFIAPLVLFLLNKNKTIGLVYSGVLILACIAVRGIIAAHYDVNQFGRPRKHLDSPWAKNGPMYQYPYTRWSVYVVGLVTGYILHHSNCKIRINRFVTVIGWVFSLVGAILVVFGLYHFHHNPGTTLSRVGSRLYVATSRTVWSLSLAWLVVACASGRGGWVNAILSSKLWAPLGRLSYSAYLIHPIVFIVFWGNQLSSIPFTDFLTIYVYLSSLLLTYGMSYIVSMIVEAPMMQLEKVILGR